MFLAVKSILVFNTKLHYFEIWLTSIIFLLINLKAYNRPDKVE